MPRTIPPADLARAQQMLAEGKSMRATAKATGVSTDTLARRFGKASDRERGADLPPAPEGGPSSQPPRVDRGRPADPAPGRAGRRDPRPRQPSKRTAGRATDEQLQAMLTKVAVAPAIPMAAWFHCEFCAAHFATRGPAAAEQLVKLASDYPDLREMLDWLHREWEKAMWAGVLASWIGVPLVHHLTPDTLYSAVGPFLGMPPRATTQRATPHQHPPAPKQSNGSQPAAPPAPEPAAPPAGPFDELFAGMNPDELIATAKQFGIEVPPEVLEALSANATPTPEPTESAEQAEQLGSDAAAGPEWTAEAGEDPSATAAESDTDA